MDKIEALDRRSLRHIIALALSARCEDSEEAADDVLAAMRDPTRAMVEAAQDGKRFIMDGTLVGIWQDMIGAANRNW